MDFFDIPWIYQAKGVLKWSNKNLFRDNVEWILSKRCSFFAEEDIYVSQKLIKSCLVPVVSVVR